MKRALTLFIALLTVIAFSLEVQAQTLMARGGISSPSMSGDMGPTTQLGIRVGYTDYIKLEGSMLMQPGIDGSMTYGGQFTTQVYPIDDIMSFNPYVYAGVARMTDGNSSIPVGIGVEYPILAGIGLNVEAGMRYNVSFDNSINDPDVMSGFSPSIGITYSIGRAKQTEQMGGTDPVMAAFRGVGDMFEGGDAPEEESAVADAAEENEVTGDDGTGEQRTPTAEERPSTNAEASRTRGVPGVAERAPIEQDTSDIEFWNDMARLPDGTYIMGLTDEDPLSLQTAGRKRVTVSSFYMDRYQVTNEEYREFVDELSGQEYEQMLPDSTVWDETGNRFSWQEYFRGSSYDNYPVIGVTRDQAAAYCEAHGMRLPTEAEWEYAARSTLSGSIYPWPGFEPRDEQGRYLANYNPGRGGYAADGYAFTAPVDEYPSNPWGLYNMSGNVAEWVSDDYTSSYGDLSDFNPLYEDPEAERGIVRGGSWASDAFDIGVGVRETQRPEEATPTTGFRCAMDISEAERQQAEEGGPEVDDNDVEQDTPDNQGTE